MEDIDEEWEKFCEGGMDIQYVSKIVTKQIVNVSDLYISTRTIICHLNRPIDLNTIFWLVPIIEYSDYKEGIIKKQMKFYPSSPLISILPLTAKREKLSTKYHERMN